MYNNKHVVILGGGDVRTCEVDAAVKLGLQVSYLGDATLLSHYRGHPQVTLYDVDMTNTELCLAALKSAKQQPDIDAVVSFTENGLLTASALAKKLRANANALFPVIHTKDKTRMRALLQQDALLALPFKHCNSVADALEFFQQHQSAILKPVYGAGSIGVSKVTTEQEVIDYFQTSPATGVLMEKFVEGEEYSVESLSFQGQHLICAITQKTTTGAPHFVELGHVLPAPLQQTEALLVHDAVQRFLNLIEQKDGPAHTEVKIDHGKVYIIESQTRVGGDQITTLLELASGLNLFTETFRLLLDDDYQLPSVSCSKLSQIRYIPHAVGLLEDVKGTADAATVPGVHLVRINKTPGTRMGPLRGSPDRLGFVLATGQDYAEVSSTIDSAMAKLQVSVQPELRGGA